MWQGQDPADEQWGCPIRKQWDLQPHQRMSPALEEKLAFTAILAGSYEAAAQGAGKWGCGVDDSVIHALVQRLLDAGNCNGVMPEFGRVADLTRLYGLRRGMAYNLLRDGKIKGVLLRVRGQKSGVRLFDLNSVRQFILSQMTVENGEQR